MKQLISIKDIENSYRKILSRASDFKNGLRLSLNKYGVLLFEEPSTRTRISFEKAFTELNIKTFYLDKKLSSLSKGETLEDTLITLREIGIDIVVFRLKTPLFDYSHLKDINISIINAGDASHEHPTQALIDAFTLEENKALLNKRILYVGDIKRSRVFRSGALLLSMMGAKVSVCGPKAFIPEKIKEAFNLEEVFYDLDKALEWADSVIALRIQLERLEEPINLSSYFKRFGITKERYKKIKEFLMHPGPVNRNLDIDEEVIYEEKSLIKNQVKNGPYVRMATIDYVLEDF